MFFGILFIGTTRGRNYAFTNASFVCDLHSLLAVDDRREVGYVKDGRWVLFSVMRTSHHTLI
jgi:hypothetical protein